MKCPILAVKLQHEGPTITPEHSECLQDQCQWWQKELKNCVVYELTMTLGTLVVFVEDIKNNLPRSF